MRKLNLTPCAHERCLYYTTNYNGTGQIVLFLRQVDDFAVSCKSEKLATQVIEDINSQMKINVKKLGSISRFNGIDVSQSRYYIKIFNKTYIEKICLHKNGYNKKQIYHLSIQSQCTMTHNIRENSNRRNLIWILNDWKKKWVLDIDKP